MPHLRLFVSLIRLIETAALGRGKTLQKVEKTAMDIVPDHTRNRLL
jgi:hypothetical protein